MGRLDVASQQARNFFNVTVMLCPLARRFTEEKADFHPRSWLSKYRRTSVGYLTKMLLFYHGIGIILLLAVTPLIEQVLPDYEQPSIPRSLLSVLAAGPLEETYSLASRSTYLETPTLSLSPELSGSGYIF